MSATGSDPETVTIAGVILAAGLSQRIEGNVSKLLLPLGNCTMLGRVVAAAESTSLDPTVIVTGYRADEVESAVKPERACFAFNAEYETGNLGSLRVGIAAVGRAEAVMLLLGDMPEVDREIIETTRERWLRDMPFAAVASYRGEVAHPFVLSARAVKAASSLSGTKPLWRWLRDEHNNDVAEVPIDRPRPRDVNTVADYAAVLESLGLEGGRPA